MPVAAGGFSGLRWPLPMRGLRAEGTRVSFSSGEAMAFVPYRTNECTFDLPAGLTDQTVNAFTFAGEGLRDTSIVLTRDALPPSGAQGYATEHLQVLAQNFPAFAVSVADLHRLEHLEVFYAEFTWRSERGPMHQAQAYIPLGARVLVATISTLGTLGEAHRAALRRLVLSLRPTPPAAPVAGDPRDA